MSLFNKRYHTPGTAPGTLVAVTEAKPLRIDAIDYDAGHVDYHENITPETCRTYLDIPTVTWIHISGHAEPEVLKQLGEMFELHALALEDVLNAGQRPKVELYDDQLFIIANLPVNEENGVRVEQVSIFFGKNYLISFCAAESDLFAPVIKRLQNGTRMRQSGADYLLYALLDLVVDRGFPLLENFGERLETLEDAMLETPEKSALEDLHFIRRELLLLRRMLWSQRDMVNELLRTDLELIDENTKVYFRDCYDHTIQIMDLIETYREMSTSIMDVYMSSVSFRLNEVMRVLTIIATLFIPPTFIVGIYGMNFDPDAGPLSMPELDWAYGYIGVWAVIVLMVTGMLIYFKSKNWF